MDTIPSLSPRRNVGFRLVVLARQWRHTIDQRLQDAGLTDATWRPLVHLYRRGDGLRQKDLAGLLGMDGSSLVRLIDLLAQAGLVERRDDPEDGRAKRLFLTEQGRERAAEVQGLLFQFETELLAGLDDQGIDALLKAFDLIESNILNIRPNE